MKNVKTFNNFLHEFDNYGEKLLSLYKSMFFKDIFRNLSLMASGHRKILSRPSLGCRFVLMCFVSPLFAIYHEKSVNACVRISYAGPI